MANLSMPIVFMLILTCEVDQQKMSISHNGFHFFVKLVENLTASNLIPDFEQYKLVD